MTLDRRENFVSSTTMTISQQSKYTFVILSASRFTYFGQEETSKGNIDENALV